MKRVFCLVCVVLVAVFLLAACSSTQQPATQAPPPTATALPTTPSSPSIGATSPESSSTDIPTPTPANWGGVDVALTKVNRPAGDVLATANGQEITWADYEPIMLYQITTFTKQYNPNWNQPATQPLLDKIQQQALEQAVDRAVLYQIAERSGIEIADEQVQARLDEVKASVTSSGGEAAWDTYLKDSGLSEAYLRVLLHDRLLAEAMAPLYGAARNVEHVHLRHIQVATEEEAREVEQRLAAGESFESLAATYSQDPASSGQGGDMGWIPKGVLVEPFEQAAFALEVGETSEPVQTEFGYHIIQLLGRETRDIDEQIFQRIMQQQYVEWFDKEKRAADIEYLVRFAPEPTATPVL